ncbi:MAG: ABC transporter permease [Luteolibacter sp.]|uniref:MlaE family ABC transporter permease n=1 Tax=Luteolibacter sp. TaxID=1962973 RepID=UPI0032674AB1
MPSSDHPPPRAVWQQDGDDFVLEVSGDWRRDGPAVEIEGNPPDRLPSRYQVDKLGTYDSTLPAFLLCLHRSVPVTDGEKEKSPSFDGLPDNLRGLLELALSVPEEIGNQSAPTHSSEIRKLGKITLEVWESLRALADFTGKTVISLGRFFTGRARFRPTDFWMILQQCGVQALPIVSLISFLIGLILAFVGNVQLSNFGANLFVADLVGIAMVREMGVVMTAIIMSGRTGAAFAALIGSMKANEEIDALRTFGFDPFDFLVLPRVLALILMMPLLTIYANVVGILGGMLVGAFVGIPPVLYWTETLYAVDLTNSSLGVIKSVFFGAAIAISGCMQGMRAGNSSSAVGEATTRSVVASITAVIVIDSAFAVIFTLLDV